MEAGKPSSLQKGEHGQVNEREEFINVRAELIAETKNPEEHVKPERFCVMRNCVVEHEPGIGMCEEHWNAILNPVAPVWPWER